MTNCVIISVSLLSVVTVRDFQDGRHVAMNISQHQCLLLISPHDETTMPTNACACGGDISLNCCVMYIYVYVLR